MDDLPKDTKVVVIGRNEGERLLRCLSSLKGLVGGVYVDSGSTDGSQSLARAAGLHVIDLDVTDGFTAAKARNAGLFWLALNEPQTRFVQMIDGDCQLVKSWLAAARKELEKDASLAAVFGRRRELQDQRNIFHLATDREWDVPEGEVESCGGDALFRLEALKAVGGYNGSLIAGEEPELCLRLRMAHWRIRSIRQEMTVHDVDINSPRQWWLRAKRAGYAITHLLLMYRQQANASWKRYVVSTYLWSVLTVGSLVSLISAGLLGSYTLLLVGAGGALICGLQVLRTGLRHRSFFRSYTQALRWSALMFGTKLAQASGSLSRLSQNPSKKAGLIEYK